MRDRPNDTARLKTKAKPDGEFGAQRQMCIFGQSSPGTPTMPGPDFETLMRHAASLRKAAVTCYDYVIQRQLESIASELEAEARLGPASDQSFGMSAPGLI